MKSKYSVGEKVKMKVDYSMSSPFKKGKVVTIKGIYADRTLKVNYGFWVKAADVEKIQEKK